MRLSILFIISFVVVATVHALSPPVYPSDCFFSVQQDTKGVWWIVDPNGQTFYIKGIDVMHPQGDTDKVTGKQPYYETVLAKYGNTTNWAIASVQRLLEWNVNVMGAWTNELFFEMKYPYTFVLNFMTTWAASSCNGCYIPDLYDPGFELSAKKVVRNNVLPRANNPYFLGYFLDNEIFLGPDWHLNTPLFSYYINFTIDSAGFQAAIAYAQSLYPTIAAVNKAWGLNLQTWNDFNNIHMPVTAAYINDSPGFDRLTANHYFNVTCSTIRAVDPNHLILGIKYDGYPSEQVIMADSEYGSDVLSIDWYQWPEPTYGEITDLWNIGKKPILFGEFAYRGNDTGLPNTHGAGPVVATQTIRAEMYSQFVQNMSMLPYTVGSLWFEWVDEPINGRAGDGENSNYGVVNVEDEVYTDLTNTMAYVHPKLDLLHGATRELPAQCKPRHVCPNACSGNGCCDQSTGRCVCTSFFSGGDCSVPTGFYQEFFSSKDNIQYNWINSNGFWGNYYTYYRSPNSYALTSTGVNLYLNATGCPTDCGNSQYAGAGLQGAFLYASGWANLTLIASSEETANVMVQWINTDATNALDGFEYQLSPTEVTFTSIYNSTYTPAGDIGLKFNASEAYHTYSLYWGSNNQILFAVDDQVLFSRTFDLRYNQGAINIYFLAENKLPNGFSLTSMSIKEFSFITEEGWKPAQC